jgi:hypothetical protein
MLESAPWPGRLPALTEMVDDVFDSPALGLGQEPAHQGGLSWSRQWSTLAGRDQGTGRGVSRARRPSSSANVDKETHAEGEIHAGDR